MSGKVSPGVVFSLICARCDAGMEIGTYEQAMDEGLAFPTFCGEVQLDGYQL
ncbi:MAG: hypothetical protein K2Y37_01330 [Pirellulales bacterium]|nr:hypothetical protein [Pirellulales bacterium]